MTKAPGPCGRGDGFPLANGGAVVNVPAAPGEPIRYLFRCPTCAVWAPVSDEQLGGREPLRCVWCGYSATRDIWGELHLDPGSVPLD